MLLQHRCLSNVTTGVELTTPWNQVQPLISKLNPIIARSGTPNLALSTLTTKAAQTQLKVQKERKLWQQMSCCRSRKLHNPFAGYKSFAECHGFVGIAALLVQPRFWNDSQPPNKREGWKLGGWRCSNLCINREPVSYLDHHYHQLI